jgi:hypothetical protein
MPTHPAQEIPMTHVATLAPAPRTTYRRPPQPAGRILRSTRWLAAVVVFFLVDAVQLLVLLPHRTAELFAWPIDAHITSFALASAYVAGGCFFVRVALGGAWSRVAAGFPAVLVFVWLAALATALHLDRFSHDLIAFAAWAAIYLVAPVGLPLVMRAQRRRNPSSEHDAPLPQAIRRLLLGVGGAVTAAGLLVFAAPALAVAVWPWELTELTARILAAVIALNGSLWISVALHRGRDAARIPLGSQAAGLAFLLLAAVLGRGEIAWEEPLAALLTAGVAAMLVADLAILARRR